LQVLFERTEKERVSMKRFLVLILIISISISLFSQNDNKTPKYLFKIATDAPDGSSWILTFKAIDKELRKQTNGEAGMIIYPSSLMGDQSTVVKKIKIGQLSGSVLSSGGIELIFKDFACLGFPMVFRSYEEYDYVKEKLGPFFESEIDKKDFILMSFTEVGFIYVFSKKKINSIQTLREAKPFLLEGDEISQALFDEGNAKPIPIQLSDILTGLQTGLIDTVFSPTYALIVTQWFTKVNYMADFPITLMLGGIVIDKKMFNSMPKEYQTIMRSLFKENFEKLTMKIRKDNENARSSLEKYGIKFLTVDKKEQEKFYDLCRNVRAKLTEKEYSKDVTDRLIKAVEEYRNKK
jgi:TRAP-type transport system periplasmic protein